MSGRPVAFVNYTDETFTPTQSGALATYIWECCQASAALGVEPWVVTRSAPAAAFAWPRLIEVQPPAEIGGRVGDYLTRGQRKLLGWPRQRQRQWTRRVTDALRQQGLQEASLLLQNDPETAVHLRRLLPDARIVLLFQNQMSAREPFRTGLSRSVDVIAAVSGFTARWIENHYQLPPGSVPVVHSGVNSTVFTPTAAGSGNGLPVIGFVGRTGIEKAPDLVLTAALRLSETRRDFAVQIVGSNHWDRFELDDYQRRLRDLSDALTARGVAVDWPGHIGRVELPSYLARTAIHVVPSRWDEPFGLTTLEGMAAGNALVASRTGGTPEVVGGAGLLFDRDDVDGLVGHLALLLDDPVQRADLARRARARAESMTWEKTAGALMQLLEATA